MMNCRADEILRIFRSIRKGAFHPTCAVLAALALLGCASTDSLVKAQQPSKAIAAPTPDGVALKITAADANAALTIKAGTTIAVELVGVPTAGYMWTPAETPVFLEAAGEYGGPTSSAQLEPGFAGGSHWEAFLFKVTGVGEGDLRFEQRRPWEDATAPASGAFSVHLIAEE